MANLIADINEKTGPGWSVAVIVLERTMAHKSRDGGSTYQKLILMDDVGTKIEAMMYNRDIRSWRKHFDPFRRYIVSNALVGPSNDRYKIVDYPLQWTIKHKTVVRRAEDTPLNLSPKLFEFPELDDLDRVADVKADIDVLAIVGAALPYRGTPGDGDKSIIQEVILIDKSMKPVLLTMWNPFATAEGSFIAEEARTRLPVILGRRLHPSAYSGTSLATKYSSVIMVDPVVPCVVEMQRWAVNKTTEIKNAVAGLKKRLMIANGQNADVVEPETLADVMGKEEKQFTAWVSAAVKVENFEQAFCYIGCEVCNKGTAAQVNQVFYCTQCEKDHLAKERPLFEVNISDDTGTVNAAIFGNMAEKHFDVVATDVIKARQAEDVSVLQAMTAFSSDERHLVQLRVRTNEFRGEVAKRFTVVVIKKKEVVDDPGKMIQPESLTKLVEKDVVKTIDKGKQVVGSSVGSELLKVTDPSLGIFGPMRPVKGVMINESSMVSVAIPGTHVSPVCLIPELPAQPVQIDAGASVVDDPKDVEVIPTDDVPVSSSVKVASVVQEAPSAEVIDVENFSDAGLIEIPIALYTPPKARKQRKPSLLVEKDLPLPEDSRDPPGVDDETVSTPVTSPEKRKRYGDLGPKSIDFPMTPEKRAELLEKERAGLIRVKKEKAEKKGKK